MQKTSIRDQSYAKNQFTQQSSAKKETFYELK